MCLFTQGYESVSQTPYHFPGRRTSAISALSNQEQLLLFGRIQTSSDREALAARRIMQRSETSPLRDETTSHTSW